MSGSLNKITSNEERPYNYGVDTPWVDPGLHFLGISLLRLMPHCEGSLHGGGGDKIFMLITILNNFVEH